MKNLYPKGKGKIHPTPSSSSSFSPSPSAVLKLLPAAILTLVSALPPEDREVVDYLIHHSIKTDDPPSVFLHNNKKCKKTPLFDCSCFDCYTSFWTRWDSSPNRDLIHQAIEAFEEEHHLLSSSPTSSSKKPQKGKKAHKRVSAGKSEKRPVPEASSDLGSAQPVVPDDGSESDSRVSDVSEGVPNVAGNLLETMASVPMLQEKSERGMVRKVWPDVLGIFNSRLWSFWSPSA